MMVMKEVDTTLSSGVSFLYTEGNYLYRGF